VDVKEAVAAAKNYISELYADEHVSNLGLEETEHDERNGIWLITLGFSRLWNTPRSRAQEVLENLGAVSSLKRSYKVIAVSDGGNIISMKNWPRPDAAE
jgi:hypothetical protein